MRDLMSINLSLTKDITYTDIDGERSVLIKCLGGIADEPAFVVIQGDDLIDAFREGLHDSLINLHDGKALGIKLHCHASQVSHPNRECMSDSRMIWHLHAAGWIYPENWHQFHVVRSAGVRFHTDYR